MQSLSPSECLPECPYQIIRCQYLTLMHRCLWVGVDVKAGKVLYCPLSYDEKMWTTAT